MDYFSFRATTHKVNSKAACDFLAQGLRELANEFESRALELNQTRNNSFHIDDKAPALHVANQTLKAWKNGLDPATICLNLSARYCVNYEICYSLFRVKQRTFERERIDKRNRLIKKWDYHGVNQGEISRRTGLSQGQVSKILRR